MIDPVLLPSAHAIAVLRARLRTIPDFPKPGIRFKDITPLVGDPAALGLTLDLLAAPFVGRGLTHVVGIESRGFIFGGALAARLGAGFVPVRKPGKLPAEVHRVAYSLEYGEAELEMHVDAILPGSRVLVVDDLLATGGTAAATAELVRQQQGMLAAFAFVVELDFLAGRERLLAGAGAGTPVYSLVHVAAEE
ncbi:MAG: adenine phosphoribosyltransferase [Deltaproteobacteria bacterium]|nr:adenine phosphoribosyltransferase [Deltaproteobacteria bacterium]